MGSSPGLPPWAKMLTPLLSNVLFRKIASDGFGKTVIDWSSETIRTPTGIPVIVLLTKRVIVGSPRKLLPLRVAVRNPPPTDGGMIRALAGPGWAMKPTWLKFARFEFEIVIAFCVLTRV